MYASSGVKLNGAEPLTHEILPGDVIEIPANENLILHPSGDEVKVEPNSSAVYTNQKQIDLRNGTSTVSTKSGVTVHVHHYTVTPTAPDTRYQVSWVNDAGRVWVYEGEVRIDGCEKKLTVPKDKIAELGRDCKVGAYLRAPDSRAIVEALGLGVPVLCYYECSSFESGQCLREKTGCPAVH